MRTLLFWLPVVLPLNATAQHAPALIDATAQHAPALIESVAPVTVHAAGDTKFVSVPGLERVAILGASVSDGFGLDAEVGARTVLGDVVEAALKTTHDPVLSKASGFLFMDPAKTGREEVESAQAKKPTLVVGIDYLFWFGYGHRRSEKTDDADKSRLARFDAGLAMLEGFTCPVLVGDLPDMSQALEGESPITHRPMLRREQIPSREMLAELNQRLAAWAAKHSNVIVVPLAQLVARMHGKEEIALRGNVWRDDAAKDLFQKDLLHPTLQGAVAVWLFAQDCLVRAQPAFPAEAFEWDASAIGKKVYDSKEPERAAKLEKQRKDKERAEARAQTTTPSKKE